ncbi:MAG: class I SAM-dependent methyltransferase [Dehalococcoidia bacterium]
MNKDFWETCSLAFAHIAFPKEYQTEAEIIEQWEREFLPRYDWAGKTVVDYGCGGAFLGECLLKRGIGKYIGLDIAERSVGAARGRLPEATIKLLPADIREFKADILVCQAVMFHMSEPDLNGFLAELNESGIPEIVLQWRHGHSTWFDASERLRCFTCWRDIREALPSYEKAWLRPVGRCDARYGGFRLCAT